VAACHSTTEIRGIYVYQLSNQLPAGTLFPCTEPNQAVLVPDSTLATRYFAAVRAPNQPAYVELRGFSAKSGSIYSGRQYFVVEQILAVRPRAEGECPAVAHPVTSVLTAP
jgi:hypothetical protein